MPINFNLEEMEFDTATFPILLYFSKDTPCLLRNLAWLAICSSSLTIKIGRQLSRNLILWAGRFNLLELEMLYTS